MSLSLTPPQPEMLAHEQFYGFVQRPFALSPDPKFLYRSASHDAATGRLLQALHRREGFLVLTGDIGTGKTTLCRALLEQMGPAAFTSLVLNPFLSVDELLRAVLTDFGVVSRDAVRADRLDAPSTNDLMAALYEFLQSIATVGGTAILIIDEAQHLSKGVLEQIRVLSNLEASDIKLLQIILVGQLNLLDTLNQADMRQFAQRVSLRATLSPLPREESDAYIRHRITVARPSRRVSFSDDALGTVWAVATGIPRVINLVCDRALAFAAQDSQDLVTPGHVRQAAAALELAAPPSRPQTAPFSVQAEPPARRWPKVAALMLLVLAAAVGVTLWVKPLPAWAPAAPAPPPPARPDVRVTPTGLDVPPDDIVIPMPGQTPDDPAPAGDAGDGENAADEN
ncbi:MAG: ExeA family protein [Vicinamibacterales bacterium]